MPADTDRLPHPQPQPLLPPDIRKVSSALNISDYTHDGVNEAIEKRYWTCVDELVQQGAQSITLAGFPIASQLGRRRVLELQEKTAAKTGVVADSHAEATLAALAHLGTRRITIASRWADELNQRAHRVPHRSGNRSARRDQREPVGGAGVRDEHRRRRETRVPARTRSDAEAPEAEALLLAGGAWRSLAAVPILEEDFGIPVVTNPIAPVWRLIHQGIAPPVEGWGRLLAGK